MFKYCLFILAVVLSLPASATVVLTGEGFQNLNGQLNYLEDPDRRRTLRDVRQDADSWQAAEQVFNQGFSRSAWWLRLRIVNPATQPQSRLLELAYPLLDYVDVYVYGEDKLIDYYHMGSALPFAARPYNSQNYLVPLRWEGQEQLEIYLRIDTVGAVRAPLFLWDAPTYALSKGVRGAVHGVFLGALGVFSLYNLLLFFAVKGLSYLYYVCTQLCLLALITSYTGFGFAVLWPETPAFNDYVIPLAIFGTVAFGGLFTNRVLSLRYVAKRASQALLVIVMLAVVLAAFALVLPYNLRLGVGLVFAMGPFSFT
ncbi:hypothetical protein CAI21_09880 [Alkalilimnicola ehrlichii]|uniref:7TMR-DISM family protein n=1 Tax=Alkalilimnicola ehrlichii TaxID=351052 RepID=UPI000E2F4EA7|nr:7TM-DISM domain-containing protein [Alkalilimnicola ehrlichii]RFA29366.1 hypothetical protein CAI21_09880 [Alkalilimnicola ehrlichii]